MKKRVSTISARVAFQIELALTAHQSDPETRAQQEEVAARHGLTGAEIDVARAGRSFDVRTAAAIGLAIAYRSGNSGDLATAGTQAVHAGFDAQAQTEILALAQSLLGQRKNS
jgi:hypothetical protein